MRQIGLPYRPTLAGNRFLRSLQGLQIRVQCWNFRTIYGGLNRVGIRLSHRPARLHRLACRYDISVLNRFQPPKIVLKFQHCCEEGTVPVVKDDFHGRPQRLEKVFFLLR